MAIFRLSTGVIVIALERSYRLAYKRKQINSHKNIAKKVNGGHDAAEW